jgi:hypothetical protein
LDLEAQLTALLKVRALKWSSNLASGQWFQGTSKTL